MSQSRNAEIMAGSKASQEIAKLALQKITPMNGGRHLEDGGK
jgi:hypothetical protein